MNPTAWMDDGPPTGGEGSIWLVILLALFYVVTLWAVVAGPLRVWADEGEWRAPLLLYGLPFVLLLIFFLSR